MTNLIEKKNDTESSIENNSSITRVSEFIGSDYTEYALYTDGDKFYSETATQGSDYILYHQVRYSEKPSDYQIINAHK